MAFFILSLLSARDLDIGPEGFDPRDDISRGLMTRAIWKRPCINLFITYFARADNMLLPSFKTFQDKYINTRIIYTYVVTVYVYTLSHHDNIILLSKNVGTNFVFTDYFPIHLFRLVSMFSGITPQILNPFCCSCIN
jgi:hypothetical protein